MTAKLLWHFDIELDGDHATWVEDARFYVSSTFLLLMLAGSNKVVIADRGAIANHVTDPLAASAAQGQLDANQKVMSNSCSTRAIQKGRTESCSCRDTQSRFEEAHDQIPQRG